MTENTEGRPRPEESGDQEGVYASIKRKLSSIKHKVVVLSGKGGVGKSTIAVNVALSLASSGKKVGLLDVDLHGPSIPTLLNLKNHGPVLKGDRLLPVEYDNGKLKVMSLGFMLPGDHEAVIWRGPMKMGAIQQFLTDVSWGELDYLIIDCPPGTGDEPMAIIQLIDDAAGAIVVTTPQEVALADVRRSIKFCRQLKLPVLGVVENMSGFVCPKCGERTDIFSTGGAEQMATEMDVSFMGRVPMDPEVMLSGDAGTPFVSHYGHRATALEFIRIVQPLLALDAD